MVCAALAQFLWEGGCWLNVYETLTVDIDLEGDGISKDMEGRGSYDVCNPYHPESPFATWPATKLRQSSLFSTPITN